MKIPLKTIYSAARERAAGYVEEVKKRGKVQGSSVELSSHDFDYISENFKLNGKPKVEVQPKVEPVKLEQEPAITASIPVPGQSSKVTHSVKNLFN